MVRKVVIIVNVTVSLQEINLSQLKVPMSDKNKIACRCIYEHVHPQRTLYGLQLSPALLPPSSACP